MQTILYHNSSGSRAFTGNLKQKEVHRAITLHPVKQHEHMYRIHNYMKALKIQDLQHESVLLHRSIAAMMKELNKKPEDIEDFKIGRNLPLFPDKKGSSGYLGDTKLLGLEPGLNKFLPGNEDEVLKWDFISRALYSDTNLNPRRRIESPLKEGLDDIVREVMDMINMYSKQRGRVIEYREILYGYHRLNPLYGADYILDMLLMYKKYRGRKMTVPVRRHVYLQQQFTDLEIREIYEGEEVASPFKDSTEVAVEDLPDGKPGMPGVIKDAFESGLLKIGESFPFVLSSHLPKKTPTVKDKLINFILPLSGRIETFKRFIAVFEDVCLKNDEKVSLIVVVFPHENEITSSNETIKLMNNLQRRYPDVRLLSILVNEKFARAMALEMGAAQCAEDDLMFFIDVDMVFTSSALHRIRTNTIQGKQVYFPIVYSEFDPTVVYKAAGFSTSPNHFLVNRDSGYWRQFGFGIASMYKSDLKRVGGFDISIHGWGKEDVELYDKFVAAAKNITIFRAADPSLVHVFHIVDCDPKLDESQLRMCRGTRADTYGGVFQLAQYIYSHKDILLFARNKNKHEPPS